MTQAPAKLTELDELLADSIGVAAEQVMDLDKLMAESMQEAAQEKAAREARKRLGARGYVMPPGDIAEDRARIAAWELRNVWKPAANVARFIEQECERCGDFQYFFTGLLQRQDHRHFPGQQKRWVDTTSQVASLPNEVMLEEKTVPFCGECLEQVGFSWNHGYTQDGRQFINTPHEPAGYPIKSEESDAEDETRL